MEADGHRLKFDPFAVGALAGEGSKTSIGADSAAEGYDAASTFLCRAEKFCHEHFDNGGLEGSADIREFEGFVFFQKDSDRCLEPAEAEIEIARIDHTSRKIKFFGVASTCKSVDLCAAGIADAQKLRDFIKCLACGIVQGSAEKSVSPEPFDIKKERVTSTHHQCRVRWNFFLTEKWREQMAFDVVDRQKRLP